jgi:hypothetical protein
MTGTEYRRGGRSQYEETAILCLTDFGWAPYIRPSLLSCLDRLDVFAGSSFSEGAGRVAG